MKKRPICAVVLLLAALCGLLPGCTGEDTTDAAGETVVIGSDIYSPFFYLDDDGKFAGIDVEIATEACRRLGLTPKFRQIPWQSKDEYLGDGRTDCLWGSFSMNGREGDYAWAGPYMYSRQVVVVNATSDIRTLKDLNGRYIAVQNGTKPDELFSGDGIPGVSVRKVYGFDKVPTVFAALKKGYVDACAGHEPACLDYMRKISGEYRVLDESLLISDIGVAFDRGRGRLYAERFSAVLSEMKADGTVRRILEKYPLDIDFALTGKEK